MPARPTSLAAAPLDAQVALTWNDPSDSTITGYSVRYSTSLPVSGSWTAVASSGATTTSHTVAGLTNGTRYYFQVRATNANGDSATSNAAIQLAASPATAVSITDANLRTALETATGKAAGATITQLDMAKLKGTLSATSSSISNLVGLEHAVNIWILSFSNNLIADVTPLAGLTDLWIVNLDGNAISDLSPLAGLTGLAILNLDGNSITDLSPVAGLSNLWALSLNHNQVSDLAPLANLAGLNHLSLEGNAIVDVPPLGDEVGTLGRLDLSGNAIVDVTPLSLNFIGWLDLSDNSIADVAAFAAKVDPYPYEVDLRANPLSPAAVYTHIPAMRRHGATVHFDPLPRLAPQAVRTLDDATLAVDETLEVVLRSVFHDPHGDPLTFSASSSRPAVATARLNGSMLTVTALAEGQTRITVRAADPDGAIAILSFLVTVGNPVSIGGTRSTVGLEAAASAPEGGVAEVVVAMAEPRDEDVSFAYSFGPDGDLATADADVADHGGEGGTVTIPAGETEATIRIPIADDDDIEPAREAFAVTLEATGGAGVGVSSVVVHIEEGVCDRSWQVADALRGGKACEVITPTELARRRTLRLPNAGLADLRPLDFLGLAGMTVLILDGNGLSALPEGLLAGSPKLRVLRLRGNRFETLPALGSALELIELDLTGNLLAELPPQALADLPALGYLYLGGNRIHALPAGLLANAEAMRILEMQDNALEAIPEGLFADVSKLFSLQLQGNPGAPFPLPVELARVEAEGEEREDDPGRAAIQLRMPHGAPFAVSAGISAPGATLSTRTAAIAAGDTLGDPVTLIRSVAGNEADAAVTVEIRSVSSLPTTNCGDDFDEYRCFRGFELTPGSPLTLFEPPTTASAPTMR